MEEHSKQKGKTIAIVIIVSVIVLVGLWYFAMYRPEQEAKEKARLEQIAKEVADKKRKDLAAKNKVTYDKLIKKADAEFELGNWETAHPLYSEASSLFPSQKYPKDQLALINKKLEEIAEMEVKKEAGIVETVSSPTGRIYVIVSSSVDGDLAMDYASKLAKEGNNVKIIEPVVNSKVYHRVSVGDYGTWKEAEAAITTASNTYGTEVWPLKY